jgi:PAS domain S-box-containing protein
MSNNNDAKSQKKEMKQRLCDFVDFGMLFISAEGKFQAWNDQFNTLTGYESEELIGQDWHFLLRTIKDDEQINDRLSERKKGVTEKYRAQIVRKDQQRIWLSVNEKPCYNEHDEFTGLICYLENISDRIQEEIIDEVTEQIIESSHRFENNMNGFLDHLHKILVKILPVENLVVGYGITDQTIWFPYIHDSGLDSSRSKFRTRGNGLTEYVMKNDLPLVLNASSLNELRLKEKLTPYELIPLSQVIVPIKNDSKVIGVIRCFSYERADLYDDHFKELFTKIGEKIGFYIERIRINSERKFFFELTDIPVMIVNRDGYFEYVNPTFLSKTKFSEEDVLNKPVISFINKNDHTIFKEAITALINGHLQTDLEFRMQGHQGEEFWFSWFAQPQVMGVSFYFVGRDITQLKEKSQNDERTTKRLLNLIKNLKEGVIFLNHDGVIEHVNTDFCKMLGFLPEELVGEKFFNKLHPENLREEVQVHFKTLLGERAGRFETQLLMKNGNLLWVYLSHTPEFDQNGQLIGIVGTISDISKKHEEEIQKERLYKLHKSFFTLNQAITRGYSLDQIHQTVLGILHSTYKINVSRIYELKKSPLSKNIDLAVAAERILPKSLNKLHELFPNGIKDLTPNVSHGSPYWRALNDQKTCFLVGSEEISSVFTQLKNDPTVNKYKSILSFMIIESYALFPIIRFDEVSFLIECVSERKMGLGEMDDLIAFMQHVNFLIDKKMSDIDLYKTEQKWRGLIENSSEVTCILDKNGNITFASTSIKRILGYTHQEVLQKNIFDFLHPDERELAYEKFMIRLIEGGMGFYQTLRIRSASGEYRFFRIFTSNHLNKVEINGLIVNAQDITDIVIAENEKYLSIIETEENERKRISRDLHDGVGQYLAATTMYMNLLELHIEDQLNDDAKKIFQNTADILRKATNEVRSVSHNIMPPSLKDFGFEECVKGLIEGLSQCTPEVAFDYQYTTSNLRIPEFMSLTLFRAIQQILNNALTHGRPDHVKVSIRSSKKLLKVVISDNGEGFDPTKKNDNDGIGILSIKHRIQSIGGTTMIKSQPSQGTTFTIITHLNP